MTMTLKPCPFCGGKATIVKIQEWDGTFYSVRCDDYFKCAGAVEQHNKQRNAIAAWNRRADAKDKEVRHA